MINLSKVKTLIYPLFIALTGCDCAVSVKSETNVTANDKTIKLIEESYISGTWYQILEYTNGVRILKTSGSTVKIN